MLFKCHKEKMTTVGDIARIIEKRAEPNLAESWDNCGLQVGSNDRSVRRIVTALDPVYDVVEYACSTDTDLLVTHHPLIFKPLHRIDLSSSSGRIIDLAIRHSLSIYSAHTSIDNARNGLNDLLAGKIGLTDTSVLGKGIETKQVKFVVFVPADHKSIILKALSETPAGMIGDYRCCAFLGPGTGHFKAPDSGSPYSGKPGETSMVEELRIETVVDSEDLDQVIRHIRAVHPYETMAYDVYPLSGGRIERGLGRLGCLQHPMTVSEFLDHLKRCLNVKTIRYAGPDNITVNRVGICAGSGSSLLNRFFGSDADVYVSGDLSYHDARNAEEDRKSTRLNSSHNSESRMPSSA
jgi:dinuclear metal center YbgI/SA1388 family protein